VCWGGESQHTARSVWRGAIPQASEWQRIGDEINTAFIFARTHFVNVHQSQRRKLAFQSQARFRRTPEKSVFAFRARSRYLGSQTLHSEQEFAR
jgi:hypothetical protein